MPAITATVAAGVGIASTLATTGMSFANASKQAKLQREAESDAAKAMADARKALDVNFYENLAIQKEPYQLEREALLSAGAQATQAGVESERGAAATAGRIQMAQQEGQRKIAGAMGQEMLGLEKLTAQEESRLRDMGVGIDLKEVEGAQLAARNAETLGAQATQQAMQGIGQLAGQVAAAVPLYGGGASQSKIAETKWTPEQFAAFGNVAEAGGLGAAPSSGTNLDFEAIGNMSRPQYQQFLQSLTAKQASMLFPEQQYNPFYPFSTAKNK